LPNCCDPCGIFFILPWSRSRTLHFHILDFYTRS
jgi:hypothetical protein